MHIHLIGVCGTGMGSLAGLLQQAGHRVTGSDRAFEPPMGDALRRWGIECKLGFDPAHLSPPPDRVVIGNVCRADNLEARAAIDGGLTYASMPGTLREFFLRDRQSFVVAGTHGKTTTTSMLAFLLDRVGREPGFLIGGLPADFEESFRVGHPRGPFVIEGDEYDSAFFEKQPKFLQYEPKVAVIHAIEHDHIDIYPDMASYREAFARFVQLLPADGVLMLPVGDRVVAKVAEAADCRLVGFGVDVEAPLSAEVREEGPEGQRFRLRAHGKVIGEGQLRLSGRHNLRNALAAIGMAGFGGDVPFPDLLLALSDFHGVARRQQLRGTPGGVRVYDDFAHHPTAVDETLRALRTRHPKGKLIAVFEPRSATASRRLHQADYPDAFMAADLTMLAPVGRPEIPAENRLDTQAITRAITDTGREAYAMASVDAIVDELTRTSLPGDTIVLMSNGAFDGIHERLLRKLERKFSDTGEPA